MKILAVRIKEGSKPVIAVDVNYYNFDKLISEIKEQESPDRCEFKILDLDHISKVSEFSFNNYIHDNEWIELKDYLNKKDVCYEQKNTTRS